MQGWPEIIPTGLKTEYLNALLKVGFDTLDCVSFVNPKAIPQMADSAQVLSGLDLSDTKTKLLAIVANERGAETSTAFDSITYLGYPFSISSTFQKLNTNSTIEESWNRVLFIQNLCVKHSKQLVIYISMGFGNPYGDPYDEDLIAEWIERMKEAGIKIVSLADTVGLAEPEQVSRVTGATVASFPDMEIGVHLHSTRQGLKEKLEAAWKAGCCRFDGALKGIGGCPMANNELVGNMDTREIIDFFRKHEAGLHINDDALFEATRIADGIFLK